MSYEVRVGAGPGVKNREADEARGRNKERDQAASSSACLPRSSVLPGKNRTHAQSGKSIYLAVRAVKAPN